MTKKIRLVLIYSLVTIILVPVTFVGIVVSEETIDGNSINSSESGVYVLRPTGDIITEWVPGSGIGYTEIDDEIPDETKTYIGTSINGRKDVYSLAKEGEINEIKNVKVYGRFITDFINSKFCLILYETQTSSIVYSNPIQLTASGRWYTISYVWEANPFTGLIWDDDDITTLGIGICLEYCDRGIAVFCTQVYAEVEYGNQAPSDQDGDDNDSGNNGDDNLPQDTPENLIEKIEELGLKKGLKNSLVTKLKNAIKLKNKNQINAAENLIQAFIKEIKAQYGKRIIEEKAEILIDIAQNIV
ncbi:MAG: hypothetical protein JSW62_03905 [Thermoplasmatales archaeon]|nr:MAG: hypothetical protein JSW62_03905 [Thermoplasmatales archaeon]